MGKEHLEQLYFAFTAVFVWFWSAAEAPKAKSESAEQVEEQNGLFLFIYLVSGELLFSFPPSCPLKPPPH